LREALAVGQENGLKEEPAASLLNSLENELVRRRQFNEKLRNLRGEGQWSELIDLLRRTIQELPRAEWGEPLDQLLYESLTRWGDDTDDYVKKQERYREAIVVAKAFGLDSQPAESRLKLIEAELARREEFTRSVETLKAKRAYADLVVLLQVSMDEKPPSEWLYPLDQWLYEALIEWGDDLNDPADKLEKYERAVAISRQYGLDANSAVTRAKAAESQLAERRRLEEEQNRPVNLPAGAQAGFVRIFPETYPPFLIADLWVEAPPGTPITGLSRKDFHCIVGGKSAKEIFLAPVQQEPPPLHVLLLMDISGSVKGRPLDSAKEGARAFLVGLKRRRVYVKIISFNRDVHKTCDWTDDLPLAASCLQPLQADGHTALIKAILASLDDLRDRKGDKCLVLFTDGQDTVGGGTIDEIMGRCRAEKVAVYAIGLRTQELDSKMLQVLATESGGEYVEASGHDELVNLYQRISRHIRRVFYRLVITPEAVLNSDSGKMPIEVRVGGESGVRVTETLSVSTRTPNLLNVSP
jgi:uncharacterized protein YegL